MSLKYTNYLGLFICLAALGWAVLYLENYLGLLPCHLCIIDRLILILMAILFFAAASHKKLFYMYTWINFVLGIIGILVAARHVWLQSNPVDNLDCLPDFWSLFQTVPLASFLDKILNASSNCATISLTLLSFSIAQLTLVLFVFLSALVGFSLYKNQIQSNQMLFKRR